MAIVPQRAPRPTTSVATTRHSTRRVTVEYRGPSSTPSIVRSLGLPYPRPARQPLTPGTARLWLRRLGISGQQYRDWSGFETLDEFVQHNPTWTVGQWIDLLLDTLATGALRSRWLTVVDAPDCRSGQIPRS